MLAILELRKGKRNFDNLSSLTSSLFSGGIPVDFKKLSTGLLTNLIFWIYDFTNKKRNQNQVLFGSSDQNKQSNDLISPYSVVAINTDDRPFLVDTVIMIFNGENLDIFHMLHPILSISRNKDGTIDQILDPKKNNLNNLPKESLILLFFKRPLPEGVISRLEIKIKESISDLITVINDRQPIVSRILASKKILEKSTSYFDQDEQNEAKDFLDWLVNDHFLFLGSRDYQVVKKGRTKVLQIIPNTGLGILRNEQRKSKTRVIHSLRTRYSEDTKSSPPLVFTKTNIFSTVRKPGHMDYIGILQYSDKGELIGERRIIGTYSASTFHSSCRTIPYIRKKFDSIIKAYGHNLNSYSGRALTHIIESLPRDELFRSSIEELLELASEEVELLTHIKTRVIIRYDYFSQFYSCFVYIPRNRYSLEVLKLIQKILCNHLVSAQAFFNSTILSRNLIRLHFIIPSQEILQKSELSQVEELIVDATQSWYDKLGDLLVKRFGDIEGFRLFQKYEKAFSPSYFNDVNIDTAINDILQIENLVDNDHLAVKLYKTDSLENNRVYFKVFKPGHTISLTEVLPILHNLGFRVIAVQPYKLTLPNGFIIRIQDFELLNFEVENIEINKHSMIFEDAFIKIWRNQAENDGFNNLVIKAQMSWQQISFFRALAKYLLQAGAPFSQIYMEEALKENPLVVSFLNKYINIRFDPDFDEQIFDDNFCEKIRKFQHNLSSESFESIYKLLKTELLGTREKQLTICGNVIELLLDAVATLDHERILRSFFDSIKALIRCNFYQNLPIDRNWRISLKFNSALVPFLTDPKPFVETFVYSPLMEGIHLRGGKVSRGGLRWSDRREDFRTEILALMHSQSVKNTVIVPVGAKGGFVVKKPKIGGSKEEYIKEGIACYQTFINGLFDISDNIIKGKIKHPKQQIRYDDVDPYLVVAADKGTATFSDIANNESEKRKFWLGDAFASGGSNGYDHKKMGITARGAWESVKRHFNELDIDSQTQPITVVGIGDMGGDVFGNGMLLSSTIKLIAAFNHLHIFIDPNPDVKVSFNERKRLFNMVAGWDKYNLKKLSPGGNIYLRSAKRIKLSYQAKKALNINEEALTPNELIRKILCASVDLLFNGGIGTYVISSKEHDDAAGDRTNRMLRVNADNLACKVIGEGGNLGLTQLARIEFAENGGKINTDFIDNSAGVDCSDHEVNIKILMNEAITSRELSQKNRNHLLESMTDEVASLVLKNNIQQTKAISLMESYSSKDIISLINLIDKLEERGLINRKIEFLPDAITINERQNKKQLLNRPELASILSFSKIALYQDILNSNIPEDPYYEQEFICYFPKPLQKFRSLKNHQLKREILATQICNQIINNMGAGFIFQIQDLTGSNVQAIIRAYTIVIELISANEIWDEIEKIANNIPHTFQYKILLNIRDFINHLVWRLFTLHPNDLDIAKNVDRYKPNFLNYASSLCKYNDKKENDIELKDLLKTKIPAKLAEQICMLNHCKNFIDIAELAKTYKINISYVSTIYSFIEEKLPIEWLRTQINNLPVKSSTHTSATGMLISNLYQLQNKISGNLIKKFVDFSDIRNENSINEVLSKWLEKTSEQIQYLELIIANLNQNINIDYPDLMVALRALEQFEDNMNN